MDQANRGSIAIRVFTPRGGLHGRSRGDEAPLPGKSSLSRSKADRNGRDVSSDSRSRVNLTADNRTWIASFRVRRSCPRVEQPTRNDPSARRRTESLEKRPLFHGFHAHYTPPANHGQAIFRGKYYIRFSASPVCPTDSGESRDTARRGGDPANEANRAFDEVPAPRRNDMVVADHARHEVPGRHGT
jgi:hypothetical protein